MKLSSILKKASYQISNPTSLETAEMTMIKDIEKFAQIKMANADIGAKIMAAISNPAVAAGVGGLAAGGGTLLASSQKENEDEEQFKKRRIMEAITNGLAGAAVGGATPIAANAIKGLAVPEPKSKIKEAIKGLFGGGVFAAGGAAGGAVVDKFLHNDAAVKATQGSLNAFSKILDNGKTQVFNQAGFDNATAKMTRHNEVMTPLMTIIKDMKANGIRQGVKPLVKKIRNPLIGAGAALTLPFILKKFDQLSNQ